MFCFLVLIKISFVTITRDDTGSIARVDFRPIPSFLSRWLIGRIASIPRAGIGAITGVGIGAITGVGTICYKLLQTASNGLQTASNGLQTASDLGRFKLLFFCD